MPEASYAQEDHLTQGAAAHLNVNGAAAPNCILTSRWARLSHRMEQ